MGPRVPDPAGLETSLGYTFKDKELLRVALTHSSHQAIAAGGRDNERLEFLGDRVLGLAVCEELIKTFPKAREGELARRYNRLVRRKMCAAIAGEIELGRYLILSSGEVRSGGRAKSTILANAMEAVLGAVFLDGGYSAAQKVIGQLWSPYFEGGDGGLMDAKTALQEWAQAKGLGLPEYVDIERSGPDHAPEFITEVRVENHGAGRGRAGSKRAAEQMAAEDFMKQHKIGPSE